MRSLGRVLLALFVISSSLVLVSGPASAHTPHDPVGQLVLSPDYANDHTIYLTSDFRVLRSTDAGKSWHELVTGLVARSYGEFGVTPDDPDIVDLTSHGVGVYRSTDHGWTWEPTTSIPQTLDTTEVAVSPESADVVYVAGAATMSKTVDGGKTWTPLETPFTRVRALIA